MTEESYSFTTARTRLEEIVAQVRKKDTSLEKSLDLLEEGVRLANACTEQIDHADWNAVVTPAPDHDVEVVETRDAEASEADDAPAGEAAEETVVVEDVTVIEDVEIVDEDGTVVAEVVEVAEYEAVTEFVDADEAWAEDFTEDALEPADPSADER